jgi:transcriptional regulator with XRE-family HTH domain
MLGFAEAIEELIAGKSLRQFAAKVPVHHHTLRRLTRGEIPLTMPMLEAIATAGKVTPFYFAEYRAMWVARAFTQVFEAHPNLSIRAVKQINGARA